MNFNVHVNMLNRKMCMLDPWIGNSSEVEIVKHLNNAKGSHCPHSLYFHQTSKYRILIVYDIKGVTFPRYNTNHLFPYHLFLLFANIVSFLG